MVKLGTDLNMNSNDITNILNSTASDGHDCGAGHYDSNGTDGITTTFGIIVSGETNTFVFKGGILINYDIKK